MNLTAFLQEAARRPFQLGDWDCSMLIANWIRVVTGTDPGAELRGRYSTDPEWQEIVARAVGLVPLVDRLVRPAGFLPVPMAALRGGDVGVVERPIGCAGGILAPSGRWIVKTPRGLDSARRPPLAAWGLR